MGSLKVPLVGSVFELTSMAKAIRSPKSVGFILAERLQFHGNVPIQI